MSTSDYENAPISHWRVEGMPAYLQSVSGFNSSTPVEGTAHQDAQGNPIRPKWWSRATTYGDVTMQRLLDSDGAWAEWRQQVMDGDKEAKRDITIVAMTADGEDVKTINCVGAWPTSHMISGMESGSDSQSFESITLSVDSMTFE
jgi:phage tail-like protein